MTAVTARVGAKWLQFAHRNRSITHTRSMTSKVEVLRKEQGHVALLSVHNGEKEKNIFPTSEFETRVNRLRSYMDKNNVGACVFTSLHNLLYYTGYLPYQFGRTYACVVTQDDVTTLAGAVDSGKPWRRAYGDSILYTDWTRDNFFRGVQHTVTRASGKIGIEYDHVTTESKTKYHSFLPDRDIIDVSIPTMELRLVKSAREIEVIKNGARIADLGGDAAVDALQDGAPEYEVVIAFTNAMVREIARTYPQSDLMDTFGWLQSGINTDGCHNPVSTRKVRKGEILSLNCFPMIQGYYTALERNLFLDHCPDPQLRMWQTNVDIFKRALDLIKPGARCCDITLEVNEMYREKDLLQYRNMGYGHSFGVMSHYYGRDTGLEIREDVTTVLEPGMVVSMEPMITIPQGVAGAGAYREHDILVLTEQGAENITKFPFGPEHNIIKK